MGVQIYIKTEALKERGVALTFNRRELYCSCACGYETSVGVECEDCRTPVRRVLETCVEIEGLDILFHELDKDTVWHDANYWGTSRTPIVEFIKKHQLLAGTDWYEA